MSKKAVKVAKEARDNMSKFFNDKQWKINIDNYDKKTRFVMGEQISSEEAEEFRNARMKTITANKLYPLINNVIGEYIKLTPNMQVIAKDDNTGSIESVEIAQAIFKRIAFNSDSKGVYRSAMKNAARGGYGVIRIVTEYVDNKSFDQEIKIKEVKDPTSCFFDANAKTIHKTDGDYCGMYTIMSKKAFESMYPKVDVKDSELSGIDVGVKQEWCGEDSVIVLDYYKRIKEKTTLYNIEDSQILSAGNYLDTELKERGFTADDIKLLPVTDSRTSYNEKIKHYRIAANHILLETTLPCDELPLIFVDQESWHDKGKQVTRALLEDAEGVQRVINYLNTLIIKLIKMQRYDNWLATPAMVAGKEIKKYWDDNSSNIVGAKLYNPQPNGERPTPIPPPEISQSLFMQYQRASEDIHHITGIFSTQIGNQGNEISGTAISRRADQANTTNISFFSNVNSAIAKVGQIIVKMMPKVYDTQRTVLAEGATGGYRQVTINKRTSDMSIQNNIRGAKFDLAVDAQMSFDSQKQQALETLTHIMQASPTLLIDGKPMPIMSVIGDLVAANMPTNNNAELTNRLKLGVPKEIIAAGKGEPMPEKPQQPDPQAMMAAQQAQLEQAKLQNEKMKQQLEAAKLQSQMQIEQSKHANETQQTAMQQEESAIKAIAEISTAAINSQNPMLIDFAREFSQRLANKYNL